MTHRVTLLPGEGIGPEVVYAARRVINATGVPIVWDEHSLKGTDLLGGDVVSSIERNRIALKGPTATPSGSGHRSMNVRLRERFKLAINKRPVASVLGSPHAVFRPRNLDIMLFRENLEDLYIGDEDGDQESATARSTITREGTLRIASCAYSHAKHAGRKKMTIGHKSNILKLTHGLFLKTAREVGACDEYEMIETEDLLADNLCMQLVMNPERFDCIVLPNFLGDLLSDLCAGLVGGLGFAPGANLGAHHAIFEAVHGTAPDIAGQGVANPTALILSGAMMLDHLGETLRAQRMRAAVANVLAEGRLLTRDILGGDGVDTNTYTDAVISRL